MLIIAQVLRVNGLKMTVFTHSQTTNKVVNEAANDSARDSGKYRKIPGRINVLLSEPIRLQDLEDSARSQAWKKINVLYHSTF